MKPIHVLVLDDEQNILKSVERLFANEPYGIVTATNSDEALAIMAKEPIKVVLSDHRMPGVTGVDFLRKVKERYPDIVRILFTGYADISAAEEAINVSEVYRFINKPWNNDELKAIIQQAIRYFDLVKENRELFQTTKDKNAELEVANRKLRAMYEIQKEFTASISHELRTPLASIKLAIDIVQSKTAGPLTEHQEEFLGKAKSNVDRLNRLINDILDLSRLEVGKVALNINPNNINHVIKDVVATQEPVAQEKGLTIKTDLNLELPDILYDVDKINQVLNNLISNAIKFTENGEIEIASKNHHTDNYIEVYVKDTGEGIREEDIPKVFQKFQQLGDPGKRKTGGTGLGLAICKEIIKQHGGRIWVVAKEGQGSSFHFSLPINERRAD